MYLIWPSSNFIGAPAAAWLQVFSSHYHKTTQLDAILGIGEVVHSKSRLSWYAEEVIYRMKQKGETIQVEKCFIFR